MKILDEKNNVLILCQDEKQAKEIDSSLWSYGRNKFIAHSMDSDKNFDPSRQPALITTKEENSNQSKYLIFLSAATKNFVESFDRAFYFYNQENNDVATQLSLSLLPKNSFKKKDGKWIKAYTISIN